MNNIVSLSGGKDSTAMLHMMLDRGEKIHSIVFFDTGWEFPQMHDHIDLVEKKTGLKIWRLNPRIPFEYLMFKKPIACKNGDIREGYGWPSQLVRWCTREKVRSLEFFAKDISEGIECVGFAYDEQHRIKDNNTSKRYPLIEWSMTEKDALEYCFKLGYSWGGLYDHFSRVSCYLCPLQRIGELRKLRKFYPDLWADMLKKDELQPDHIKGFKDDKSVHYFEKRFSEEDRQLYLDDYQKTETTETN